MFFANLLDFDRWIYAHSHYCDDCSFSLSVGTVFMLRLISEVPGAVAIMLLIVLDVGWILRWDARYARPFL